MANARKNNIKRFIETISPAVAEDAYHGGGSGSVDGFLIKTIKQGQKIRVDLSKYTGFIYQSNDDFHNDPMKLFDSFSIYNSSEETSIGPKIILDDLFVEFNIENYYRISMIINEAQTQVLCEMGYPGENNNYYSLMPATVVYESATPIEYEEGHLPEAVMAQLPIVEIALTSELVGKVLSYEEGEEYIHFDLVD